MACFYSQMVRTYLRNSYSLTTYKVKIVCVFKSLHISLADHWFLRLLEIFVKGACRLRMLKVNREMCSESRVRLLDQFSAYRAS